MQDTMIENEGKWINFVLVKKGEKTDIWHVATKDRLFKLGEIKWYGRWRTYAYFPYPDTVYEDDCLRDISDFIEGQMRLRRKK